MFCFAPLCELSTVAYSPVFSAAAFACEWSPLDLSLPCKIGTLGASSAAIITLCFSSLAYSAVIMLFFAATLAYSLALFAESLPGFT